MKPLIPVIIAMLASGCSTPIPNSQLQEAEASYRQAPQDKPLQRFQPASLNDGYQWLRRAQELQQDNDPPEQVGHAAYMSGRLLEIAHEQSLQRALSEQQQRTEQQLRDWQQQEYEASVRKTELAAAEKIRQQQEAKDRAAALVKSRQEAYQQALAALNAEKVETGWQLSFAPDLFSKGKTELSSQADGQIDSLAQFLIRYPDHQLRIRGFSNQASNDKANLQLATQSAQSLYRALLFRAILPERMSFAGAAKEASSVKLESGQKRVEVLIQAPDKP